MIVDWAGLGTKISNMALDVQKTAEDKVRKAINFLGMAGIMVLILGLILIFKGRK